MITPQQPVKEGHFLWALRRHYGEGFQSAEPAFDRRWQWVLADRQRTRPPRATVIGGPLAGWQAKQAFLLQLQQHRAAGHVLEPPHFVSRRASCGSSPDAPQLVHGSIPDPWPLAYGPERIMTPFSQVITRTGLSRPAKNFDQRKFSNFPRFCLPEMSKLQGEA